MCWYVCMCQKFATELQQPARRLVWFLTVIQLFPSYADIGFVHFSLGYGVFYSIFFIFLLFSEFFLFFYFFFYFYEYLHIISNHQQFDCYRCCCAVNARIFLFIILQDLTFIFMFLCYVTFKIRNCFGSSA